MLLVLAAAAVYALAAFALLAVAAFFLLRWWLRRKYERFHRREDGTSRFTVGFFHPYCDAGGGGERVLWCALRAVQNRYEDAECVVYTGDKNVTAEDMLSKAEVRFDVRLPRPVRFVFLGNRYLVEADRYPHVTMLGQSLGSIVLGLEALTKFVPAVYLDTMGYAFTMPLFKFLGGCKVACYVHYPTISTDMLSVVKDQRATFNNSSVISRNPILSCGKLAYYRLFAQAYGLCGRCADIVMVNSSWTLGHVNALWRQPAKAFKVFPPCDVGAFQAPSLAPNHDRDFVILSLAQFRPEKNHLLQLKALQLFLKKLPPLKRARTKLVLVGSCRNEDDEARVKAIKKSAKSMHVEQHLQIKLNASFEELKDILPTASVGLHTMWNEHFGIGIVECMAAGMVVLAHDSGGPKMDIVVEHEGKPTGFLASTAEEYASALHRIYNMPTDDLLAVRSNARASVQRFSDAEFEKKLYLVLASLMSH